VVWVNGHSLSAVACSAVAVVAVTTVVHGDCSAAVVFEEFDRRHGTIRLLGLVVRCTVASLRRVVAVAVVVVVVVAAVDDGDVVERRVYSYSMAGIYTVLLVL
jgi:hypothetical protein